MVFNEKVQRQQYTTFIKNRFQANDFFPKNFFTKLELDRKLINILWNILYTHICNYNFYLKWLCIICKLFFHRTMREIDILSLNFNLSLKPSKKILSHRYQLVCIYKYIFEIYKLAILLSSNALFLGSNRSKQEVNNFKFHNLFVSYEFLKCVILIFN